MRLAEGDIAISLGTSDTVSSFFTMPSILKAKCYKVFGVFNEATPSSEEGHIFCSPTIPGVSLSVFCR